MPRIKRLRHDHSSNDVTFNRLKDTVAHVG